MYLFVDESGTNKQSGFSVFAVVLVEDKQVAALNEQIKQAGIKAKTKSFHWKSTPWPVRINFLSYIAKGPYSVRYAYYKNPITDLGSALESTILTAAEGLSISKIILDGRKSKAYEKRIKKTLRDQGLSSRKLKTADDEAHPVLRLADAYAGLLRHHSDKPSEQSDAIFKKIRKRLS